MPEIEPSKYTMPLDRSDIEATYLDWVDTQPAHRIYSESAAFHAGYNRGVIDALAYVGKQDQICWNNGYAEGKRETDIEAGYSHDAGIDAAHRGVQDVMQPEDSALDFFLGDGEKPVCRIKWFNDPGDMDVGMYPRCGWVLDDDQAGTELETLLEKAGVIEKPTLDMDLPGDTDPDFQVTPSVAPALVVTNPQALTVRSSSRYYVRVGGRFSPSEANNVVALEVMADGSNWWIQADGVSVQSVVGGAPHRYSESNIAEWVAEGSWRKVDAPPGAVRADTDGWIAVPDDADTCPVDVHTQIVVKLTGEPFHTRENYGDAGGWVWSNAAGSMGRITHYKVKPVAEVPAETLTVRAVNMPNEGRKSRYITHRRDYNDDTACFIIDDDNVVWLENKNGDVTRYSGSINDTSEIRGLDACIDAGTYVEFKARYQVVDTGDSMTATRYYRRNANDTGFGAGMDYVKVDGATAVYLKADGTTDPWTGTHAQDDFTLLVKMGLWEAIEGYEVPASQPDPENAVATLPDGWIPVPDDYMKCPVYDDSLMVEIRMRNDGLMVMRAGQFVWDLKVSNPHRIVAYRVPAWKDEPEADEIGDLHKRIRTLQEALANARRTMADVHLELTGGGEDDPESAAIWLKNALAKLDQVLPPQPEFDE